MTEEAGSHRRTFVAKRLDRSRWWPVTLDADNEEVDATLRAGGFDPTTRRELARRDAPRTSSLEESRWVRIMADYYADGVWNQEGESCLVDALPVSLELQARLQVLHGQDGPDRCAPARPLPGERGRPGAVG